MSAIKEYKSPVDPNGEYRVYTVHPVGNRFAFTCMFWTDKGDGTGVGSMKAHDEYDTVEEAIARYNEFLEAWEPDLKK